MGLLGGSATLKTVDLDPATQGLINKQSDLANQGVSQVGANLNQGLSEAGKSAFQSDSQMHQSAAQTGQDPHMMEAIRNQFRRSSGQDVADIVQNNNYGAYGVKGQMYQSLAAAQMAQQQVQTSQLENLMQANMMAEQARASVLTGVLGLAGSIGGAYAGGAFRGRHASPMKRIGWQGGNDAETPYRGIETGGGPMDAGGVNSGVMTA